MTKPRHSSRRHRRPRNHYTRRRRDSSASEIECYNGLQTAQPERAEWEGSPFVYSAFIDPAYSFTLQHQTECTEDAMEQQLVGHEVGDSVPAPGYYDYEIPVCVEQMPWYEYSEDFHDAGVLMEGLQCECCADLTAVLEMDIGRLQRMARKWWEGLRVLESFRRAMYEVANGKPWEVEDGKEAEGVERTKGLRRDEWECDFCGPECFCWTVDGTECGKVYGAY